MNNAKPADLIKGMRLTCTAGANLLKNKMDDWQKNSDSWRCRIDYHGRQFSFDFFMGSGHNGKEPQIDDVLYSLLNDASAGTELFETFCANFDYDTDSRKAEATWKACQEIESGMRRLLAEDYDTFLNAERN